MPDITMCHGKECPMKEKCYRYMALANKYQSFFMNTPHVDGACESFWPIDQKLERKENGNPT